MYTVSNDKRFAVSDVNFDSKMIEINKSVHNYTKLLADEEKNRLFAATEGGIVELYSLDKYPPEKRCRIRIHGAGCISDFCYNTINSHLFICDKSGKISVIEIGDVRKEKTSAQISQFGFKNCLSVIEYIDTRHEIITGDINGKVTVWNIKTGDPIISWIAHKNMAITRIRYNKENNILITGSKGKSIKIWKIPEFWYDKKFEEYETEVLTKINNELRKKKIQMEQIMQGNDVNYESEKSENEEDLNGWNYDSDENIDFDNINAPPEE
jgi:WD40 repeat protein